MQKRQACLNSNALVLVSEDKKDEIFRLSKFYIFSISDIFAPESNFDSPLMRLAYEKPHRYT